MKKITLPATVTVKELADRLGVSGAQVVKYLMTNGVAASMNQSIDFDTAALAADHFGFEAESEQAATRAAGSGDGTGPARARHPLLDLSGADPAAVRPRPPVITVLGHVDHGKTSLLDRIRGTDVAAGEAGGITQRIGAYQIERNGRPITFIDTPGHHSFTKMRARGANVTDVAILVIAADDGVMPQTEEAIQHIRAANVPIVIALNKVDKDNANVDRVLQQLVEHELVPTEYGGETEVVRTSARTSNGIDDLLETVLIVADIAEPRAVAGAPAVGAIIEAVKDPQRGPLATVLVQNGTLRVGDAVVAGNRYGRVRALVDDRGRRVKEAGPSTPVQVIGLNDVPEAGDMLQVLDSEKAARTLAEQRITDEKKRAEQPQRRATLALLAAHAAQSETKNLNIVLKADMQGTLEALRGEIEQIDDPTVKIRVVATGVGSIGESDVDLAAATEAVVIGFNVRPDGPATKAAERQGVDVRFYDVIYQVTDDLTKAMRGMYEPTFRDVYQGRAEVRRVYVVDGKNSIAGSNVIDGRMVRNATVRILRADKEIHRGRMDALKRFKDDVREVARGYDCGITVEGFTDFAEGDILEAYTVEQQNL